MQKYIINSLVVAVLFLLASCHNATSTNLLSPFSSFPSYSSRMTLAQSVQDALMRSEDPVIARVSVETQQNTVILSGYVKKIRQSDVAEQIAHQVPGVQNVENNIIVRP